MPNNILYTLILHVKADVLCVPRSIWPLTEDTNKTTNRIFCNEVYGSLVLSPELSQAHISDIVYVMKILSENVMDENGYVRMLELRNTLQS